jgi:hypothetical protein
MNTLRMQIDFYKQDEVSVSISPNTTDDPQSFGEILLFAALALRQLHNLGSAPAAIALSDTLAAIRANAATRLASVLLGAMSLIAYRGTPGPKQFLASLEYEADKAKFFLDPKGFGFLGQGVNYYAPNSVLALFQFLADKHAADLVFRTRISEAAALCSMVYSQGKVTPFTQTGLAVGIARHVHGDPS